MIESQQMQDSREFWTGLRIKKNVVVRASYITCENRRNDIVV